MCWQLIPSYMTPTPVMSRVTRFSSTQVSSVALRCRTVTRWCCSAARHSCSRTTSLRSHCCTSTALVRDLGPRGLRHGRHARGLCQTAHHARRTFPQDTHHRGLREIRRGSQGGRHGDILKREVVHQLCIQVRGVGGLFPKRKGVVLNLLNRHRGMISGMDGRWG